MGTRAGTTFGRCMRHVVTCEPPLQRPRAATPGWGAAGSGADPGSLAQMSKSVHLTHRGGDGKPRDGRTGSAGERSGPGLALEGVLLGHHAEEESFVRETEGGRREGHLVQAWPQQRRERGDSRRKAPGSQGSRWGPGVSLDSDSWGGQRGRPGEGWREEVEAGRSTREHFLEVCEGRREHAGSGGEWWAKGSRHSEAAGRCPVSTVRAHGQTSGVGSPLPEATVPFPDSSECSEPHLPARPAGGRSLPRSWSHKHAPFPSDTDARPSRHLSSVLFAPFS